MDEKKVLRLCLCLVGALLIAVPVCLAGLGIMTFDATGSGVMLLSALVFFIAATVLKILDSRRKDELYKPLIGTVIGLGLVFLGKLLGMIFS